MSAHRLQRCNYKSGLFSANTTLLPEELPLAATEDQPEVPTQEARPALLMRGVVAAPVCQVSQVLQRERHHHRAPFLSELSKREKTGFL